MTINLDDGRACLKKKKKHHWNERIIYVAHKNLSIENHILIKYKGSLKKKHFWASFIRYGSCITMAWSGLI